jgi:hypothetical protein
VATGAEVAGVDGHALPAINTAKVMQSMQGSEMRVGMHSAEFGNVSVSTMLNRQSIAAQISFEHMDLGKAIAQHLPSIEAKLSSEYGMNAKVEVRDQSLSSAADSGRGEERRGNGSATASSTTALSSGSTVTDTVDSLATSSIAATLSEGARLDIRV